MEKNLTKTIDPLLLKEEALKAIPVNMEEVIMAINRVHTSFISDSTVFCKTTIRQLILGESPYRWMLAILTHKYIFGKEDIWIEFYSEALDIKIIFNDKLKFEGFDRPRETALVLEKRDDQNELFYTKKRTTKRLKKSIKPREIDMMKKALLTILKQNNFIKKPGTIQGFFYNLISNYL